MLKLKVKLIQIASLGVLTLSGSSCFLKKKTGAELAHYASSATTQPGIVVFQSLVLPVFQQKCATCHNGNTSYPAFASTSVGTAYAVSKNYVNFANVPASSMVIRSGNGHGGRPQNPVDPAQFTQVIQAWAAAEAAEAQGALSADTTLRRPDAEVMIRRLQTLFGSSDVTDEMVFRFSEGLDKGQYLGQGNYNGSDSSRASTSVAAQFALRSLLADLCDKAANNPTPYKIFSTGGILLPGESLPTGIPAQTAFAVARNTWAYPFLASDPEVQKLQTLYSLAAAGPGGAAEARKNLCLASLLAPQFWIGVGGSHEAMRRVAIDLGRRVPTLQEYASFKSGALSYEAFVTQIQSEDGFKKSVRQWHRDWLGLRDFSKSYGELQSPNNIKKDIRGWKEYFALEVANGIGGTSATVVRKTVAGQERKVLSLFGQNFGDLQVAGALTDSENCELGSRPLQNFNPKTQEVWWEHLNANGVWQKVGGWVRSGTSWTKMPGTLTISAGNTVTTTLDDLTETYVVGEEAEGTYPTKTDAGVINTLDARKNIYAYMQPSSLYGTGYTFTAKQRRLRRFALNSAGVLEEQNGYSAIKLWWSGETVYVCNAFTRYAAACAYRPYSKWDPIAKVRTQIPPNFGGPPPTTYIQDSGYVYPSGRGFKEPFAPWFVQDIYPAENKNLQFLASQPRWERRGPDGASLRVDAMGHPTIFESFRCGAPQPDAPSDATAPFDLQKFPKGSEAGVALNDVAVNVRHGWHDYTNDISCSPKREYSWSKPDTTQCPPSPEKSKLLEIYDDITQEPLRLVDHIVSNNRDYRELLTADYTFAKGPYEVLLRGQNYFLPTYPAGLPSDRYPGAASYGQIRQLYSDQLVDLSNSWVRNSYGDAVSNLGWGKWGCGGWIGARPDYPEMALHGYGAGGAYSTNMHRDVPCGFDFGTPSAPKPLGAKPISGILTQAAYLAPAGEKPRSVSARIFRTLLCSEMSAVPLTAAQDAIHTPFIPTHEKQGAAHVQEATCFNCHRHLDPLAAALSTGFLELRPADSGAAGVFQESLNGNGELGEHFLGDTKIGFSFGIRGNRLYPSSGAVLGSQVNGVRAVGERIANSTLFGSCVATKAFEGIFGRGPANAQEAELIATLAQRFQAGDLNYNYKKLIEALVLSPIYRAEN